MARQTVQPFNIPHLNAADGPTTCPRKLNSNSLIPPASSVGSGFINVNKQMTSKASKSLHFGYTKTNYNFKAPGECLLPILGAVSERLLN